METMRPRLRSIMPSSTARVQLMNPHMSIAISFSHSARGLSTKSRSTVQPAQLTSTSTPPKREPAAAAIAWADSQEVTSVTWTSTPGPASAAVWRARASSRSAISTRAPSAAKPITIARPMLEAPPLPAAIRASDNMQRPAKMTPSGRPSSARGRTQRAQSRRPQLGSATATRYPMVDTTPNLPLSYVEHHATVGGDPPALIDGERTVGFAELRDRALMAAGRLLRGGVAPGEVVGLQLGNVWEYPVLELALPRAGAIVLPLPLN